MIQQGHESLDRGQAPNLRLHALRPLSGVTCSGAGAEHMTPVYSNIAIDDTTGCESCAENRVAESYADY
jgi:hypothetical protein